MTIHDLAEAVRKMSECDGRPGVKWDLFEHADARDRAYSLAATAVQEWIKQHGGPA